MRLRTMLILLALTIPRSLRATSVQNVGPLARADAVSVEEVMVAGTAAPEGVKATELFDSSLVEVAKFKTELKLRLEKQLSEAGIKVTPGAPFTLFISVSGGKYEPRRDAANFFALEIFVAEVGSDCNPLPVVTKLGVVSDEKLSKTLQDTAAAEVEIFIHQRTEYRKSIAPAAN